MESSAFIEGPRHAVVTSDNVGPVIQVVAWFLMVVMISSTLLRLLIRFTTVHTPGLDDALVFVATLVGIAEVIAISVAVHDGLGRTPSLLSVPQLYVVGRSVYAANILYLFTIAFAKASTIFLLNRLAHVKRHVNTVRIVAGITLLWAIAALLALSFQCDLPTPWPVASSASSRCIDMNAYWYAIGVLDIALDVALVALPAWLVWNLQMSMERKLTVVSGFMFRFVLCGTQLARLVFLNRAFANNNMIYETLGYTLATQCQTTLAVVVAGLPALKPFMDRAASGLMGISFRERGGTFDVSDDSHKMEVIAKKEETPPTKRLSARILEASIPTIISITGTCVRNSQIGRSPREDDADNYTSFRDFAIHRTVDWEVRYSDEVQLYGQGSSSAHSSDDDDGGSSPPRVSQELPELA